MVNIVNGAAALSILGNCFVNLVGGKSAHLSKGLLHIFKVLTIEINPMPYPSCTSAQYDSSIVFLYLAKVMVILISDLFMKFCRVRDAELRKIFFHLVYSLIQICYALPDQVLTNI